MAGEQGSSEEKTLEPSERKLQKTHDEGRFAQSRDLSFLLMLAASALAVVLAGPRVWAATQRMVTEAMHFSVREDPLQHLERWANGPLLAFCAWLLGFMALAAVFGALAPLALAKFQPVFALRFDPSRLDPLAGLGRMFSGRNLFALIKGVLVTVAVILVGAGYFLLQRDSLLLPPSAALPAAVARLASVLGNGLLWLLAVVLVVAVADAAFEWLTFRNELRMSLQDMKDENKESEGSPEIRARLRSLQRDTSRRRMMSAVEKADVVVVNPTHYAVALRYDTDRMAAPTVIAKGTDEVALRIRELARKHDIPLAESPMLARWLTAHVELGAAVPPGLYGVIAQLMAWALATRAGGGGVIRLADLDASLPEPPA